MTIPPTGFPHEDRHCTVQTCAFPPQHGGLCPAHRKALLEGRPLQPLQRVRPVTNHGPRAKWRRKRKTAQVLATPVWLTDEHWDQIKALKAEAGRLTKVTGKKWTVDHIIPILGVNVSGLHVPWNMRVVEDDENQRKANRVDPNIRV